MLTAFNKFGFQSKHPTDQCIYLLKEIVDSYGMSNSYVFVGFLDAIGVFDRVDHRTLF